jgi:hypothetical protein
MPRQLVDVDVQFISLVKKGANREKVTIFKSADFKDPVEEVVVKGESTERVQVPGDPSGLTEESTFKKFYSVMKNFFGGKEGTEVSKSKDINTKVDYNSFNSILYGIERNFSRAVYALEDAVWHIFWNDQIENGKELILKNIDEFKTYVSGVLDGADPMVKKEFFMKSTDKIQKELEVLKSVSLGLNDSIEQMEKGNIEKGAEEEVTKKEMQELLGPIAKSIEELSTKVTELETKNEEVVTKTEEKTEEVAQKSKEVVSEKTAEVSSELKSLLETFSKSVTESLGDISSRLATIEETRGLGNGTEATGVEKDEDPWAGVLFK